MKAPELIHQLHPLLLRRNGELIIDESGGSALCLTWMGGKTGRELYDLLRECLIIVQGLNSLSRAQTAVKDMHRLFIEPIGDAMLAHARGTLAAERHRKNEHTNNQPMRGAFKTRSAGIGFRKG
ncbi:MAG: hypothetical protein AAFU77_00810 [Myxococcota bacterium]